MGRVLRRPQLHVLLLAGGSGTRFWPASRAARPKQFLALAGARSLIQASWDRARRLTPAERIWVVTPRGLARQVRQALPDLAPDRVVLEPAPRDTGPAVALGCATVARRDPGAVLAVFPTDHVVRDAAAFTAAVKLAVGEAVERNALVCLGIRPDKPATGFGYLQCATAPRRGRAVAVARFVEKPDRQRAERFVRSGRHLWNAGMFVWRAERFLGELARTAPAILAAVEGHLAGRRGAWTAAPRISVDYAVMEHARDVRVVPLDAGWDDVGSWDAAARLAGGAADGHVILDSPGSFIFDGGQGRRLIALVGIPDAVVVDTPDALLIVARGGAERVKAVVDELRRRGRTDIL